MKWNEALNELKKGKKVRRRSFLDFTPGRFLKFVKSGPDGESFISQNCNGAYSFWEEDFEADDWEVFPDKLIPLNKRIFLTENAQHVIARRKVKQSLKLFIKVMEEKMIPSGYEFYQKKAKEIFGNELID